VNFDENEVENNIKSVLSTVKQDDECEIAFFGGSFTGIDRGLMVRLLDIAQKYVNSGDVVGIRMSTRPDYINEEIVNILKGYKITFVELGIQSMNDNVLSFLKRGHSSGDTVRASNLLKSAGIPFVGQMMIGLPTATKNDEIECARRICELGASASRIYPTLVFCNTELEELTRNLVYTPLSVDEAVYRSAEVLHIFVKNHVDCIRIGLCESDNLHSDTSFVAGPNHPSIGEMVKSALYLKLIDKKITENKAENIKIYCPVGATSQIIGNKAKNKNYLREKYGFKKIQIIESDNLKPFDINISTKEE
jgi:histone acetyltransferase (RNA polymerase elongator complex component)